MSTLYKEYVPLSENGKWKCKEKKLKITLSYRKEGVSWATSQRIEGGYCATVVPIEVSDDGRMESYGAFTGFNDTVLPVARQSAKRLQTAIEILQKNKDKYIQYFAESSDTI